MKLLQAFRMSIKAVLSKKARSFLTMLGIIIGVAAVVILVSMSRAQMEKNMEYYRDMGENIVRVYAWQWVAGSNVPQQLEEFVTNELGSLTTGITPDSALWNERKVIYQSKTLTNSQIMIGSGDYGLCKNYKIAEGRDLSYMDIQNGNRVVVLGSRVKDMLFNYKNPIGEEIKINNEVFEVIGVYKMRNNNQEWSNDDMMVIPYTLLRIMAPQQTLEEYSIKAASPEAAAEIVEMLNTFLATIIDPNYGHFNAYSMNEGTENMEEMFRSDSIMLVGIAAISLIVGGIGIMNIMLVTVTERTREIGIRKAIGAERRSIIAQFLIEAAVLSSIGGLLGVLLGFLITLFWGKITYDTIVLPWWPMTVAALIFSVLLGIGFGLYPAVKASALQPVEALRNE